MRILITGGLGYIGGRLAGYIKKENPETDILLTRKSDRPELPDWTKEYTVLTMDLLNEASINDCVKNRNIDIIIHLAALNEMESMENPLLALRVNTECVYNILNIADASGIKKFIYFSTFHVYGDADARPITEETPTKPFHPYAITHRAAEDFVNYFRRYHRMQTLIFRLSNGYGCPMDKDVKRWTLAFNDLCKQAATTGKMSLKSSGKQHRDFISLNNVARAVNHFIFQAANEWGDGLYNLGGECSMSILAVAEKIAELIKIKYPDKTVNIESKSDDSAAGAHRPVSFRIDKLKKTGFELADDMDLEINKTLELCEQFAYETKPR